ncbi:MAG: ABC transporter ATP-binding protein [Planctomycetota bacterium]
MTALLEVETLTVEIANDEGVARIVDGISFAIGRGETLCLVGESGCGKSMTALALMQLVPAPARITAGVVRYDGRDLTSMDAAELRRIRGNRIAMIFQEPMTALNPVFSIGHQIDEVLRVHQRKRASVARADTVALLRRVGIADAEARARQYPHQLSGGMKQRVMIAMALACRPALLIADEPTTALDVTIQAQILELLRGLRHEFGMSLLLITHDLGVVAEMADRVAVMYAGRLVECADVASLFRQPQHPYTVGLFHSLPRADAVMRRLEPIPGAVPRFTDLPSGCRFRSRCPHADQRCAAVEPDLVASGSLGAVACHYPRTSAP